MEFTPQSWLAKVGQTPNTDGTTQLDFAGIKFAEANLEAETIVAKGNLGLKDKFLESFYDALSDLPEDTTWVDWLRHRIDSKNQINALVNTMGSMKDECSTVIHADDIAWRLVTETSTPIHVYQELMECLDKKGLNWRIAELAIGHITGTNENENEKEN